MNKWYWYLGNLRLRKYLKPPWKCDVLYEFQNYHIMFTHSCPWNAKYGNHMQHVCNKYDICIYIYMETLTLYNFGDLPHDVHICVIPISAIVSCLLHLIFILLSAMDMQNIKIIHLIMCGVPIYLYNTDRKRKHLDEKDEKIRAPLPMWEIIVPASLLHTILCNGRQPFPDYDYASWT